MSPSMSPTAIGDAGPVAPFAHTHVGPDPIDPAHQYARARVDAAGAVVQFLGTVRNHNNDAAVASLEYEAYPEMAEKTIARIIEEARSRWPFEFATAVHRTGRLDVGDIAVCITVSSAHRVEAFAACRHIMDRLKATAPIWKRETLTSGTRRWVEEEPPHAGGEG